MHFFVLTTFQFMKEETSLLRTKHHLLVLDMEQQMKNATSGMLKEKSLPLRAVLSKTVSILFGEKGLICVKILILH